LKTNLLTTLLSEIQKKAKDECREITTDDCLAIIRKFINNTNELLAVNNNNEEAKQELAILTDYLPTQLTNEDLQLIITQFCTDYPNIKIGDIMKYFKENYNGQYNGKELSEIIKKTKE